MHAQNEFQRVFRRTGIFDALKLADVDAVSSFSVRALSFQ